MRSPRSLRTLLLTSMLTGISATPVFALENTPETDADVLANLLFPGTDGLIYTSGTAVLDAHTMGEAFIDFDEFDEPIFEIVDAFSSGTFTNASGSYGIGTGAGTIAEGIVLSNGDIRQVQDNDLSEFITDSFNVPASTEQNDLLFPVTGLFNHNDVTQLTIPFNNTTGDSTVLELTVVFGTQEFPDFVGTEFNDGFAAYLNGTNIALAAGQPMNVNHPQMAPLFSTPLTGVISEIQDGLFDPRFQITGTAEPGENILTLIIGDATDTVVDSAVYVTRDTIDGPAPDQPRLPDEIDPDTGGFIFNDIGGNDEDIIFIDPVFAIGYTFEVFPSETDPDPRFDGAVALPMGDDSEFFISFGSVVDQPFIAGEFVDFLFDEPDGVSTFTITGISSAEMLDPTNPLAFVTGVSFVGDTTSVTVVQTPIIPEPASIGTLASVMLLAHSFRRQRHR